MAAETPPTGMDHAEMKRFLLKSKQEPVNCALGIGDDKSVALLMLSPHRSAKSLQGDLQKQFPTAFNTRFGTAMVDTDDDPTLVKFMLNKAVTSMARRLVKTLKGTGFRKVQILLEDGSPVGGRRRGGRRGSRAASQAQRPKVTRMPDASALAQPHWPHWRQPHPRHCRSCTQKEALAKQAREANYNIKVGTVTYAAVGIELLRRALDAVPGGGDTAPAQPTEAEPAAAPPPPPAPPPTVEARPDAAALSAALAVLVPRVADVADRAQKEALAKQAREANVNIKTGNLAYAAAGIEGLRRALHALAAASTPSSGWRPVVRFASRHRRMCRSAAARSGPLRAKRCRRSAPRGNASSGMPDPDLQRLATFDLDAGPPVNGARRC